MPVLVLMGLVPLSLLFLVLAAVAVLFVASVAMNFPLVLVVAFGVAIWTLTQSKPGKPAGIPCDQH